MTDLTATLLYLTGVAIGFATHRLWRRWQRRRARPAGRVIRGPW